MGRPAPPVESRSSVRPRASSTVLAVLTAFLPFVGLPVTSLGSVLDGLVEGAERIVGFTEKSKRQKLVDFGKHVENMVNQLVSALRNDQLVQEETVRQNLEELQKVLDSILGQISRRNSSGWVYRIRRLFFPDENHVPRMRQQLDDALRVFYLFASVQLLLGTGGPSMSVSANDAPESSQPQMPDRSSSPNIPIHRSDIQGSRDILTVEQVYNTSQLPSQVERPESRPETQRTRTRLAPVVETRRPDMNAGEIEAAFLRVQGLRWSNRHNRTPRKTMQLATAVDHLSALLANAGRTRQALEASQESAELYRRIARGEIRPTATSVGRAPYQQG
ncbi:unnamed protein product [Rhizoctonia solani]|uniref:Uncharacterized protein n=1 Tax=Rhizoctonia solani TaxID=456999 RepID=A0A8H2WEI2_9AGAM|nr:unnamed protein product [Rhizoctonia solani]